MTPNALSESFGYLEDRWLFLLATYGVIIGGPNVFKPLSIQLDIIISLLRITYSDVDHLIELLKPWSSSP